MSLKRLLFIQDSFQQSGGERHLFEIIKIIHFNYNRLYDVSFLLIDKEFKKDYFYYKLNELNVPIKFLSLKEPELRYRFRLLDKVLFRLFKKRPYEKKNIKNFDTSFYKTFLDYDLIINNKIFLLKRIQSYIPKTTAVVHHAIIHSNQYAENPYDGIDLNRLFVTYPCEQMKFEIENQIGQKVLGLSRINMPATLNYRKAKLNTVNKELRLAYLARLNYDKAFIIVLCAIHELVTRGVPVKCFLIGRRENPNFLNELLRNIGLLHIENNIELVDHLVNLESLDGYKIDVVLAGGVNDFIGYSSIEIIAAAYPVLIWDQSIENCEVYTNDKVFPKAKNVTEYCDHIEYYYDNPDKRLDLIKGQQEFVDNENSPELIGEDLDKFYAEILENKFE